MNSPSPADANPQVHPSASSPSRRGRWKWGFAILLVACIAQSVLWTMWWADPTHFKMSILFVWPAALFTLSIWWTFFSGWSWLVRLGTLVAIGGVFAGFITMYRMEFDGDMVPRRIVLRSEPTAEEIARQFLKQKVASSAESATLKALENIADSPKLVAAEGDWPGFRGPRRDGIVLGGSLRKNWDLQPPRKIWRHPIGRAWSAFAVVGKYAFTQEQREEFECVVAYDAETGEQQWVHQDKTKLFIVDANGGPGPHATPQFDDGLIYSLGGTGILNCLDAITGQSKWAHNILEDAGDGKILVKPPEWGVSNSPLIVDDLVVVIPGGSTVQSDANFNKGVAAYNKKTGERVWAFGEYPASYGSPQVASIHGVMQLLIPNGNGLSAHALDRGKQLWFFPLANGPKVNSAMPWVSEAGTVVFGTGYGIGTVKIDINQTGDDWEATKIWASNRFRPKFNDFVVQNGHVFGLDDGTLTCLDIQDGTIKWKSGRYGYGQLLLVDQTMIIISEDGELVLVPADLKKPEPVARFKAFDSGFCWNHLAFVGGRLFARNANEAACFDVGAVDKEKAQSE